MSLFKLCFHYLLVFFRGDLLCSRMVDLLLYVNVSLILKETNVWMSESDLNLYFLYAWAHSRDIPNMEIRKYIN